MHEYILLLISAIAFLWGMCVVISTFYREEYPKWFTIGGTIALIFPMWFALAKINHSKGAKTYTTDVHIQYNVPFAYDETDKPFLLNDEALIMKNPKVKVTYAPAGWYFGVKCEKVFQFEVVESLDTPEKIL